MEENHSLHFVEKHHRLYGSRRNFDESGGSLHFGGRGASEVTTSPV